MSALDRICTYGVVPVVVIDDCDAAPALGDALIAGGLPVAEITFRTSRAVQVIELLANDPRLTVGAGTIVSPADVNRALDAGAQFIVSPGFDAAVVRRCRELDVAVIPGVATPSDAMAALREGLDTVKLFPAQPLGGIRWLNALAAPFPGLRFVPTGGIGLAELAEYARHPAVTAVGGSWIAPRSLLRSSEFDEITRLAAEAVTIVAAARQ
ncbi:MAG TPA: bifunctional 4-hydroxy-2-oxoglutarate aldolase/2-dehydro-3-deoxy-phosphogluconate aldolase, partial [Solirubrobacteraceae bacterium]